MESKIWCKHTPNLNDIFLKMLCISGIKYLHLTFQEYFTIIFKHKEKEKKEKKRHEERLVQGH